MAVHGGPDRGRDVGLLAELLGSARDGVDPVTGVVFAARDRAAAMALARELPGIAGDLRDRQHLVVRGGMAELWRTFPEVAPVGQGVARLRATTRAGEPGLVFAVESSLGIVDAGFDRSGRVYAFGTGGPEVMFRPEGLDSSWVVTWSRSGEPEWARAAGFPRDESGCLALSPDGRRIAINDHRSIAVFALPGMQPVSQHRLHEGPHAAVFLTPDQLLVLDPWNLWLLDPDQTSVQDGWPLDRSAAGGPLIAHAEADGSGDFAVDPDQRFVVLPARTRTALLVHELPSLRAVAEIVPQQRALHGDGVHGLSTVALSPCGGFAVSGEWGTWATGSHVPGSPRRPGRVLCWDLRGVDLSHDVREVPTTVLGEHAAEIERVRFLDDRTVISGGWDGEIITWDRTAPGERRVVGHHNGLLSTLTVDATGDRVLSADLDGTVKIWDVATLRTARGPGPPPPPLRPRQARRVSLRTSEPGTVVVTVNGRNERWSTDARQLATWPAERRAPADPVTEVRFPRLGLNVTIDPLDETSCLRITRADDEFLDTVAMDAHPAALAPADDNTLAVLDRAGHLSFYTLLAPPP